MLTTDVTGSVSGSRSGSTSLPGSFPTAVANSNDEPPASRRSAAEVQTQFEVDQSQPTTSVQIRLADGTRYVIVRTAEVAKS